MATATEPITGALNAGAEVWKRTPTRPGAISRCRHSPEIGGPRGLTLDQAQPLLDALDPAIHIVRAELRRGVVDRHRQQVAFNRGHPGSSAANAGLDTVKPSIDARAIAAEQIEDA